jgi:hydrogenase expression/formation protein HypC
MCLTLPVRVLEVEGSVATVEVAGRRRQASTAAVASVAPGDWAILAAGVLVRVLEPEAARQIAAAFRTATTPGGLS